MRKIREVLRLKWACGLTERQIAKSCALARSTVGEYLRRATEAGLSWPLPETLDDVALEAGLFPTPLPSTVPRSQPHWPAVHQELKRKGVTLALLWQEYRANHPDGYQYSRFCDLYRRWTETLDLPMRQEHKAGEKTFVDYTGHTVPVREPLTGETRQAQIFVAVLGASSYTFAEATWTQSLPDWTGSHARAFAFFGGVTELVVPDNLKSGVSRPCRYEPDLNPSYAEMAAHYGIAVVPARVRKPKDKAKAEVGVQVAERWILARLRNRTFFSLGELNAAIAELLTELNQRPMQKLGESRRSLFERLEKPVLRPLPPEPYQYADWRKTRVGLDYHVEVDGHHYSVPHRLVKQPVELRLTATTLEVLHRGKRVASHALSLVKGGTTTVFDHMPRAHQRHREWTPEKLLQWAHQIGPATVSVFAAIQEDRPHPEQGFRSCLGIQRLAKHYGSDRLEAACRRALATETLTYRSIQSILQRGLDRQPLPEPDAETAPIQHPNIRGPLYYRPIAPSLEDHHVDASDSRHAQSPEAPWHGDSPAGAAAII